MHDAFVHKEQELRRSCMRSECCIVRLSGLSVGYSVEELQLLFIGIVMRRTSAQCADPGLHSHLPS